MAMPPLAMKKEDVEIAISRQFKKDIPTLEFTKGQRFDSFDSTSNCALSLQERYYGEGEYTFQGQVGMWDYEHESATTHRVSGRVSVECKDNSPVIEFIGAVSCRKM